jgi:hypothetical protein
MALLYECIQKCVRKPLDTADIVRDGDVTPTTPSSKGVTLLSLDIRGDPESEGEEGPKGREQAIP